MIQILTQCQLRMVTFKIPLISIIQQQCQTEVCISRLVLLPANQISAHGHTGICTYAYLSIILILNRSINIYQYVDSVLYCQVQSSPKMIPFSSSLTTTSNMNDARLQSARWSTFSSCWGRRTIFFPWYFVIFYITRKLKTISPKSKSKDFTIFYQVVISAAARIAAYKH